MATALVLVAALPLYPNDSAGSDRIFRQQDRDGQVVFSDVPAGAPRTSYRVEPSGAPSGAVSTACTGVDAATLDARATRWRERIARTAQRHDVDPALLEALIRVESCFDPAARSTAGALGLTQLMPKTAEELGVQDPFDAAQNLEGGARYLARMLARYDDETLALAAYNAGPGNVDRHGGVPPFPETRRYVVRIARLRQGPRTAADHR